MILRRLILIFTILVMTVSMIPYAQECSAQSDEAWEIQADNDFDLGNYEEAIVGYTCMIELDGELVSEGYEWRGISYQEQGDLDAALVDLNIAVTDPENVSAYYSRGNVFLDLDEYDLAIADYTEAIANRYTWAYVYNNRGVAHHRAGDSESARRDYEFATGIDPEYGLAFSNLSEINFELGDIEATRENLEIAIRETSGSTRSYAYENRGRLAYVEGDYTSAISDFTTAIEQNADNVSAYINRALVYQAMQSPNEYADYLRYMQKVQTEIIDLSDRNGRFYQEQLDISYGVLYRASFQMSSGDHFTAIANAAEDSTVDPLMVLLGPSGSAVFGDDDGGVNQGALINRFPIAQDGIYTLLIGHSIQETSGIIELTTLLRDNPISDLPKNQLTTGDRVEIFSVSNEGAGSVNLREYPSTGFEVLAQLESGTQVTLTGGPYKDADYVWWQAETDDGTTGWLVEYLGGVQILSPAIYVGRTVVIDTAELNFRADPTVNGELVRSLYREAQATFEVIDGPIEADNLTWWKLRMNGDEPFEAWAVDRVGNNPTLAVVLDD